GGRARRVSDRYVARPLRYSHERRGLTLTEELGKRALVLEHLSFERLVGALARRGDRNALPTPILARARAQDPSGIFQAVDQRHHAGFVDAELARELDLRDAWIGASERQRAEHSRADLAGSDRAGEIAPERDLSATNVVAEQRGEDVLVDGTHRSRLAANRCLFGVGFALHSRNLSVWRLGVNRI